MTKYYMDIYTVASTIYIYSINIIHQPLAVT